MKGDKRKLRAINDGTIYDAPAKTIQLGRKMRSGEMGRVLDVLVAVRRMDKNGEHRVTTFSYGAGKSGDLMLMVKVLESDFLG